MSTDTVGQEWSKDALYAKAQRYSEVMLDKDRGEWEFWLWASLTLELLIRASIANISPALIANGRDFNNILYAVGVNPVSSKFTPRSADIMELLNRSEQLFESVTGEVSNFCSLLINKRNTELHSGELAFEGLGTSYWLPRFYTSCNAFLRSMDESLFSLLGKDAAEEAETHIEVLKDESSRSVQSSIKAHKHVWDNLSQEEKERRSKQGSTLAIRYLGHRVQCPACGSDALVHGSVTGTVKTSIDEEGVLEKQEVIPSSFECAACDLKISGYSKLVACGLGNTFTKTSHYDAAEYFGIDQDYDRMMEEDNNEPW